MFLPAVLGRMLACTGLACVPTLGGTVDEVLVFFGKNQFNLANELKATQVHDSDTPSRSHRDWWGSGQYIIT